MFYKIAFELNLAFAQITFDKSDSAQPKYLDFDTDGLLPKDSKLPRFEMIEGSIPMDLINSSAISSCLVLSNNVVRTFAQLRLPIHQYFDLTFVHKKKIYDDYQALYIARDPKVLEMIDWEQSEFYKTKDFHKTIIDTYKFKDWEEMVQFDKSLWDSEFGFLRRLKIRYDQPYDIIKFGYHGFPPGYICTENVKSLVEEMAFTGFQFELVKQGIFI